jgi:hypothetical protein
MNLGSVLRFLLSLIVPIAFSVAISLAVAFFFTPVFLAGAATLVWLALIILRERWIEGVDGLKQRIKKAGADGIPLYAFVSFHLWLFGMAVFSVLVVILWLSAEDEKYSLIMSIYDNAEFSSILFLFLVCALFVPPIDRGVRKMWMRRGRS